MIPRGVKLFRWSLLLLCLLSWITQSVAYIRQKVTCVTPDGKLGNGVYTTYCESRKVKLVCSIDTSASLPVPPNCGVQQSNRVPCNQMTKLAEFPWTALLLVSILDRQMKVHCGGSLINKRYVLTAAHCVTSLPPGWKMHNVLLGEWDLSSYIDCEDGLCNEGPINVGIEKIIVHEGFSSHDKNRHNDIALIRLARDVEYSGFIRPICLPLTSEIYLHQDEPIYSAGWYEDGISKKLKMELSIVDSEDCSQIYQRDGVSLQSTQMCTSAVRPNDTCCGDSGGPLMERQDGSWFMYGVASFLNCGRNGVPDVYSDVSQYIVWIRDNIE